MIRPAACSSEETETGCKSHVSLSTIISTCPILCGGLGNKNTNKAGKRCFSFVRLRQTQGGQITLLDPDMAAWKLEHLESLLSNLLVLNSKVHKKKIEIWWYKVLIRWFMCLMVQYANKVCRSEKIIARGDWWCCAETKDTKHVHGEIFLMGQKYSNNDQNSPRLITATSFS